MNLRPRQEKLALIAALIGIAWLAYSNSFSAAFTLDNTFMPFQERVHALTWANLRLIWGHTYWWPMGETGLYRPLITFTYLFNYVILGNGANPLGYHVVNLVIHTANVLLAYAIALRIFGSRSNARSLAFYSAAIWAVHPVLTEDVTNIVGRADLLVGFSVLASLRLYIDTRESSGWRRAADLFGIVTASAIGVASKETAVMLCPALILYEAIWWRRQRSFANLRSGVLCAFIPSVLFFARRASVLAAAAKPDFSFLDNPLLGASFWQARLTALKVLALYLKLLVWPVTLSCDYSFHQIPFATGTAGDWAAWTVLLMVSVWTVLLYRHSRAAFFFAALSFLSIAMTSNLLMISGPTMAERFLYVAAFGFAACLVLSLNWVAIRINVASLTPTVVALLVCLFGIRTWMRNLDWQTPISLATATVAAAPLSFRAHKMLAEALLPKDPADANLDRAIEEMDRGIAILVNVRDDWNFAPGFSEASDYHRKKGDLLRSNTTLGETVALDAARGEWERARSLLLRGIAIKKATMPRGATPMSYRALATEYGRLAVIYSRLDMPQQEYEAALEARRLNWSDPKAVTLLGQSLLKLERHRDAAQAFLEGRMLLNDKTLNDAADALERVHADDFDLAAQCEALQDVTKRARDAGWKASTGQLGERCKGLSASTDRNTEAEIRRARILPR